MRILKAILKHIHSFISMVLDNVLYILAGIYCIELLPNTLNTERQVILSIIALLYILYGFIRMYGYIKIKRGGIHG